MPNCTAILVNFQTPDLTSRAVRTLRTFYPDLPLLIVDNGSRDESRNVIEALVREFPGRISVYWSPSNIHHGPAMDRAARMAATPLLFFLDSDCEIIRGGFLELMREELLRDPACYAVGIMTHMNQRGFDAPAGPDTIPYIRPMAMLLRRESYLALPPFQLHGAPCLDNMLEASARGYRLIDFPVHTFVRHDGRGTAERHGYALGWRGKLNHLLHKLGF